jgi:hypothetical protein
MLKELSIREFKIMEVRITMKKILLLPKPKKNPGILQNKSSKIK